MCKKIELAVTDLVGNVVKSLHDTVSEARSLVAYLTYEPAFVQITILP